MSSGDGRQAISQTVTHRGAVDSATLAAAQTYWREQVDRWIVLQLTLGSVLYVAVVLMGMAVAARTPATGTRATPEAAERFLSSTGLTESLAGVGGFVTSQGAGAALGMLQVVAGIAIALIATRFPALDNVLDAVAVTHWSVRLKVASALVAAVAVTIAIAAVVDLGWTLTGCSVRCDAQPIPAALMCVTAGLCVSITAASKVTGVDRAGEELLLLETTNLTARVESHRALQRERAERSRLLRGLRVSVPRGRAGGFMWWLMPLLAGWAVLLAWVVTIGGSASFGDSGDPVWLRAVVWTGIWGLAQVGGLLLLFAGRTVLQPAWVARYETGRNRVGLVLAMAASTAMVAVGALLALTIAFSTRPASGSTLSGLLVLAFIAPSVFALARVWPRADRASRAVTWRPEPRLEERVLVELEQRLVWMRGEYVRRVEARERFVPVDRPDGLDRLSVSEPPTRREAWGVILGRTFRGRR